MTKNVKTTVIVIPVLRVPRVLKDPQVLKGYKDPRVLRGYKDLRVLRGYRDQRVLEVPRVVNLLLRATVLL